MGVAPASHSEMGGLRQNIHDAQKLLGAIFSSGDYDDLEIRCFDRNGRGVAFQGWAKTIDEAMRMVREQHGSFVCFGINPRKRGGSREEDVTRIRMIPVDFDPIRPRKSNSTDDEKYKAFLLANEARELFHRLGWRKPPLVDSGNGYHLYLPVDLPIEKVGQVERFLKELSDYYSNPYVEIDSKLWDSPRVLKIPGTVSVKHENNPDRPWRETGVIDGDIDWTPDLILTRYVSELDPWVELKLIDPSEKSGVGEDDEIERYYTPAEIPEPSLDLRAALAKCRPVFKWIYEDRVQLFSVGGGDAAHTMAHAAAVELIHAGASYKAFHEYFMIQAAYDRAKTDSVGWNHIHKAGYSRYSNYKLERRCAPIYQRYQKYCENLVSAEPILDIPPPMDRDQMTIAAAMREDGSNFQLFKPTRSKMTTSIVVDSLTNRERCVIFVPRTNISETTIPKAVGIAQEYFGTSVKAAVIPNVLKSCLKMALLVREQRDRFHGEPVALEHIPVVFKRKCVGCEYANCTFDVRPGETITESDCDKKLCLYATVYKKLDEFNLIVMTDRKLAACIAQVESAMDNEYIDTENLLASRILTWIERCDLVVLDEVSQYTDAPYASLDVLSILREGGKKSYDLLETLEDQVRQIQRWKEDGKTIRLGDIYDEFKYEVEYEKIYDEVGVRKYARQIDEGELDALRDEVPKMMKRVQQFAETSNVALRELDDMLIEYQELEWIVVDEPSADYKRNVHIYIRPKFGDMIQFIKSMMTRVIAIDATMPLVDLNDLFGIDFRKINVGDPDKTAAKMKIIPYPRKYAAPQITTATVKNELREFVRYANDVFGSTENFMIATSDSHRTYSFVKHRTIPDVDVMWHRSGDSIGVDNPKRIMLGAFAPYTPRGVGIWLKEVYPSLLEGYTDEEMWFYDMARTLYQTLSRAKDPHGEERSVFIAFGITENELRRAMNECVCPPDIMPLLKKGKKYMRAKLPVIVAWFWMEHGHELTKPEQIAVCNLLEGKSIDHAYHMARGQGRINKGDILLLQDQLAGFVDRRL